MSKMLQMIQQSAVPANIMRSASRGALALPAAEMLEILVYLSSHHALGEQSRMNLAQWDEASAVAICSDANAPTTVLSKFLNKNNWRPALLRALFENPAVTEQQLERVAEHATVEAAQMLLASPRVHGMKPVLEKLAAKHRLRRTPEAAIL